MNRKHHLIVSVTLNPCIDTVMFLNELKHGDTNRVTRIERDAGGKGINLSRMVQRLGGETIATGFIGGGTGAHVISVLDSEKVPHDFVHVHGVTRTNIVIESTGPPTCFNEPGPEVTSNEIDALLEEVKILARESDWIAIGGAVPPGVRADIFCVFTEIGHAAGAKVLLDADALWLELGLKAGPDLIKPNKTEAERLLARKFEGTKETTKAAEQIREQLIHDQQRRGYEPIVVISLGAEGAVMACKEGTFVGASPKVSSVSTIGSGDSMLGAFVWALEQNKQLPECLQWGLAAGAATATSSGAQLGSKSTVLALLRKATVEAQPGPASKNPSLATAANQS